MQRNFKYWIQSLGKTDNSWSPLILRVALGGVLLPHGAQKLLGWFGGYGFEGTMGFFVQSLGLPWIIGAMVIFLESLGALMLIAGAATRLVAFSYIILALGIMATSHLQNGFFMNWGGNQAGEGIEYFLLWLGMALVLVFEGGGRYSLDFRSLSTNAKSSVLK